MTFESFLAFCASINLGSWIQTGAIVASAVFAGIQLRLLRKQNTSHDLQWKQRATIDAVTADKRDDGLNASRERFAEMKRNRENFTSLGAHEFGQGDNLKKNQAILDILNNYEFMAAGIHEGAFDEEIFKRMKCSLIIKDWEILEVYIVALRRREERPKLFKELEWLANRWKNDSSLKILD